MGSAVDTWGVDGATVVAFEGDADLHGAAPLRDALARAVADGEGPVIVDLTEAAFIDSCGISTLLNGVRRLTRQGRRMAVVADHPVIVRPLQLTHLEATLRLRPSVRDALEAVGDPG